MTTFVWSAEVPARVDRGMDELRVVAVFRSREEAEARVTANWEPEDHETTKTEKSAAVTEFWCEIASECVGRVAKLPLI